MNPLFVSCSSLLSNTEHKAYCSPDIAERIQVFSGLPTPVPLTPGQVIRIQITPSATSSGGTGKQEIILRIQLETLQYRDC
jgi:hypothetical protein